MVHFSLNKLLSPGKKWQCAFSRKCAFLDRGSWVRMGAITPATRGARPRTCSRAARIVGLVAAHVALERARGGALLAASAVRQLVLLAYLRCYRPLKCPPPPPQATPHAWLRSSLPSSAGPPPGSAAIRPRARARTHAHTRTRTRTRMHTLARMFARVCFHISLFALLLLLDTCCRRCSWAPVRFIYTPKKQPSAGGRARRQRQVIWTCCGNGHQLWRRCRAAHRSASPARYFSGWTGCTTMSNRWSIGWSRRLKMRPRRTSLCQLGASCRAESTRPLRRGFGSFWSSSSPVTPSSARSLRAESSSRRCRKARLCSRTSSSSSCSRRFSPTSRLRPNLRCSGCIASRQATGFTAPGRGATLCPSGCCSSRSFRCRGWSSRPRRCPSKTRCV